MYPAFVTFILLLGDAALYIFCNNILGIYENDDNKSFEPNS